MNKAIIKLSLVFAIVGGPALTSGTCHAELSKLAAERSALLKKNIDQFELQLAPVLRQVDKPFYSLTLTRTAVPGPGRSNPFVQRVQITKDQAEKIIAHLAATGFLDRSTAWDTRRTYDRVSAEGYVLIVKGIPHTSLEEELGWNLAMLQRLDALREIVDGDAAKAMDLLIGRLTGLRQQWEREAATGQDQKP